LQAVWLNGYNTEPLRDQVPAQRVDAAFKHALDPFVHLHF
jgi:hypothetical protein